VLGIAGAALALANVTYEKTAEARDRRKYPPPGRLVDVGGHRLHISRAGEGCPAVVIIPALGGLTSEWLPVQDALASRTSTAVYDRPGFGWSDPACRRWPTAIGMARELHALLDAAAVQRPLVLAGHSLGGLVARVYTQMYRDEMAGLALIDSSHPRQAKRLPKPGLQSRRMQRVTEVALDYARPLGLRRLRRSLSGQRPGDAQAAFALSSRQRRAEAKELLAFDAICRETGMIAADLGGLPLAVVTSSELAPGLPAGSEAQRARSRFYPAWLGLQRELAALSADSVHVVARSSGHMVHRDDPDLVINAIAGLVQRIRER
jgi:pimeloyl-ACP methyl ester carboxylesterase